MSLRVCILGAGYAGLRAARDLARAGLRGAHAIEITLVDRSRWHEVVTLLHQTATEDLPPSNAVVALDRLLPAGAVRLVQSEVVSIEPESRTLRAGDRDLGPFDYLVIALGSVPSAPPIPGLERAFPLRRWEDAERLRRQVRAAFAGAANGGGEVRLVVVGGGFTGCQLAGELAHWSGELADEYGVTIDAIRLVLVQSGSRLLSDWDEPSSREAERILRRKGIEVRTGVRLARIGEGELELDDGTTLETETVVWVGGVQAPELLSRSGLPTGAQGRLVADAYLRVKGRPRIYAIGDAVAASDGRPLPATAAYAQRQGAYVARALTAEAGGGSVGPYRPIPLGMLVSLGGDDAVGELLGVPFERSAAGWLKRAIEASYARSLSPGPG